MLPERITEQHSEAKSLENDYLIGSLFRRHPEDSTSRYTKWANGLTQDQLNVQIYTSNGPTIIMPTWFCHRNVFTKTGGFTEEGRGTPEDLMFFYKHLDLGGRVCRVEKCLVIYYFHEDATTFSIHENTIWNHRLVRLEEQVLPKWDKFTIWNAGKQGRKLYNSLRADNRNKVLAMCDVDIKKISRKYTPYDPKKRKSGRPVEILHFKDASPPFVICVKLDLTDGAFEKNLDSLNLTEGVDYIYFS